MVLNKLRASARIMTVAVILAALSTPAIAQKIDTASSILDIPEENEQRAIRLGAVTVQPFLAVETEFDDNVYANDLNKQDDFKFIVNPALNLEYDNGNVQLRLETDAQIRRFAKLSDEDSESGSVISQAAIRLGANDRISLRGGWARLVEDRGDPEARQQTVIGPRLADHLSARFNYTHSGTRVEYAFDANAEKFDFTNPVDLDRDNEILGASARVGYRISGSTHIIGVGFVTRRNYQLATDFSGINRDATTYGVRGGLRFSANSPIRGQATIGVFRFDSDDVTISSRTGVSAAASLIMQPNRRLAFTLDAFNGDVATVRIGATSRSDTRFQLGVQQEVRHNLYWQAGVVYNKRKYKGGIGDESLWAGLFNVEYRFRRNMTLAFGGRYADQSSNIPGEDFGRLRAAVTLRIRY